MTKLLEQAVAELRELPEETQDLAAQAMFMVIEHSNEDTRHQMTAEQIEGVRHAMAQADRGEFASEKDVRELFGRAL
jgi:hypothetical protein